MPAFVQAVFSYTLRATRSTQYDVMQMIANAVKISEADVIGQIKARRVNPILYLIYYYLIRSY